MPSVTEKYVSNNFGDAHEKMSHAIAYFKGEWVYLSNWRRNSGVADVTPIDPEKLSPFLVDFSKEFAENFCFGPYPLGFCVVDDVLYYASRSPVRKNKFGLREDNIMWAAIIDDEVPKHRVASPFATAWRSGALYRMLNGEYPGFKKALKSLQSAKIMFEPISRDFALVRGGLHFCGLFYKTTRVGEVDLKTGKLELYPSFDHLQERVTREIMES